MSQLYPPLPYTPDALEPHISRQTVAAHYGFHQAAYAEKTRALVRGTELESASLSEIVRSSAKQSSSVLFNASAQAWNHAFYWRSMRPGGGGDAHGAVANLIEDSFASQRTFTNDFVKAASNLFGSGWVWLVLDNNRLRITATANAETPLTTTQVPLLVIDIWEHAYYLDYQHRRLDYITAFLAHLVDWDFANHKLALAVKAHAHTPRERAATLHGNGGDCAPQSMAPAGRARTLPGDPPATEPVAVRASPEPPH